MGDLPTTRVQSSRLILITGVDNPGTISLSLWPPRNKTITKFYNAIFVWFVTKSVHIDVVTSIFTEPFLTALSSFSARREKTKIIYSGNGTKFRVANEHYANYKGILSTSQMETVRVFLSTDWCDLKFIQPHGPHFGGLWEAAVKSMKYHLRRTLGSQVATYEELCTLLAELEDCLNSRNLCALYDDLFNTNYLSTGNFLIGKPLN